MKQETAGESRPEQRLEQLADELEIKQRSVKGIITLLVRTGFLQIVAIAATFLLTVFLEPAHYGVFAIAAAAVDILVYFSDIGLAGALIQKKQITRNDLSTTFTVQQALSLSLVIVGFLTTSLVAKIYSLSPEGIWLFRALLVSFFLSTLKTIPSINLERSLNFHRLVIPQIIESLSFYGIAVYLAWQGWGVTSFTVAVLTRSLLGLIAIYAVSPWKPSLKIDKRSFKTLASFGVPFQLNSLLGLIKDRLLVVYYGAVLPAHEVGYLQWAERWSLFPLRMVVDNINKVTFPAYSRLQSNKQLLAKAIEKSLFFTGLFIFPVLTGLVVIAPTAVEVIPQYQKWQPALLALVLFAVNASWSSVSTTLTNSFAAIGKIKLNLKLMMLWTSLTWVLTPLFLLKFGYPGVALASALVATTSIIPMIIVKRLLPVRLLANLLPQLTSAALMGAALQLILDQLPLAGYRLLLTAVAAGAILYATLVMLMIPKKLTKETSTIKNLIT